MVPHLVFLPRILLPFTWYSWSLPTTANGITSCWKNAVSDWAKVCLCVTVCWAVMANSWRLLAYPDFVIDQSVLCILVELFLRVNVDPVGS